MDNNGNQYPPEREREYGEATGVATKFCKFCGSKIPADAVVCVACGRQVEALETAPAGYAPRGYDRGYDRGFAPQTVVVNNTVAPYGRPKSKLVALLLCFFLGYLGIHRFYEGKIGTGILWMLTAGLFGIGMIVDLIILICRPNTYYV